MAGDGESAMELTAKARFASHTRISSTPFRQPHLGPCIEWTAARRHGYGVFHPSKSTTVAAHRYALERKLGRPIGPGMYACHKCDNPPCVNPDHLYEGSPQDNVDDAVRRDRHKRGQRGAEKLTDAEVVAIRERRALGELISALSREYGVSESLICAIGRGYRWAHSGGPRTLSYNTNRKAV